MSNAVHYFTEKQDTQHNIVVLKCVEQDPVSHLSKENSEHVQIQNTIEI